MPTVFSLDFFHVSSTIKHSLQVHYMSIWVFSLLLRALQQLLLPLKHLLYSNNTTKNCKLRPYLALMYAPSCQEVYRVNSFLVAPALQLFYQSGVKIPYIPVRASQSSCSSTEIRVFPTGCSETCLACMAYNIMKASYSNSCGRSLPLPNLHTTLMLADVVCDR